MKRESLIHLAMIVSLLMPTTRSFADDGVSRAASCGCGQVKQALATEAPGEVKNQVKQANCEASVAPEPDCKQVGCDEPGCDCAPSLGLKLGCGCDSPSSLSGCDSPGSACGCSDAKCGCDSPCASGCDAAPAACDSACDAVASACDKSVCTGQCGCQCLQCCDQWSVFAGALFLNRSDAGNYPLVVNQNTGGSLVNTRDFDSGTAAAPMFSLVRTYCDCWGWDIGYFGTDAWSGSNRGGGNVSPALNGPGVTFPSTAPGTVMQTDYSSQLYSAEFNIRRRCNQQVTYLAGFRWVEFGDTVTASTIAPTTQNLLAVDTTNQMYGFQIGADAVVASSNRARIDAIVRAGVLGNHIDHRASSPLTGNFGTVGRVFAAESGR